MKAALGLIVSAALFLLGPEVLAEDAADASSTDEMGISDPRGALNRAIALTGFDFSDGVRKGSVDSIARIEKAIDSTTPFLGDYITGRTVWKVTLDSVVLDLPGWTANASARQKIKNYEVTIDKETGQLFHVFAMWQNKADSNDYMISADQAMRIFEGSSEKFHRFCDTTEHVSLASALAVAAPSGIPFAKEIHAWLVYWSRLDGAQKLVWIIVGMPVKKWSSTTNGESSSELGLVWSYIDAKTGKLLGWMSAP